MRYKIIVAYDGSDFSGYQKQDNQRTVQGDIENALQLITKEEITVHASGRTDAGVHAKGQVIHFDTALDISSIEMKNAINSAVSDDVYVRVCNRVRDDFHSRYDVKSKEYQYLINVGEYNPLLRKYVLQYGRELDIVKMQEALTYLIGEHDFTSFTSGEVKENGSNVRTILSGEVTLTGSRISVVINGSGFLKYMVRTIVGTLVDVGRGKIEVSEIENILNAKSRSAAGPTIDACGLYLNSVFY